MHRSVPLGESTQVSPASIFLPNNRHLHCVIVYLTCLTCLDTCCGTGVDGPTSVFFGGGGGSVTYFEFDRC